VTPSLPKVIELVCDGKTEGGPADDLPKPPITGVLTLLLHRLCDEPDDMLVRRRKPLFLRKRTPLWRRVEQTKIRAADHGEAGLVYVVDTEGDKPQKKLDDLNKGRSAKRLDFPMAIGVCHPCVEAWLLADAVAIQLAFKLPTFPPLPSTPEDLPGAPKKSPGAFYKKTLATAAGQNRDDLSAQEKSDIIQEVVDLAVIEAACAQFQTFAREVRKHIRPVFFPPGPPTSPNPPDPASGQPDP
jgi:Domain of unknown function (DUF4276)